MNELLVVLLAIVIFAVMLLIMPFLIVFVGWYDKKVRGLFGGRR